MKRSSLRVAALAVLLSACAIFARTPTIHRYQLAPSSARPSIPSGIDIELRNVAGTAPFHDTGIVFQTSPYRLDSYPFHRWVAPPSELVGDALNAMLNQPVAQQGKPGSEPAYYLDARIFAFQEVREGAPAAAGSGLVEIEFCLTPDQPFARPVWCQTMRKDTAESSDTAESAAASISTSFNDVLAELAPKLSTQAALLRQAKNN